MLTVASSKLEHVGIFLKTATCQPNCGNSLSETTKRKGARIFICQVFATCDTYGKVDGKDAVEYDEDVMVGEPGEAVVQAGGKEEGQDLEVKVERGPRSWLMLRHTANREVKLGECSKFCTLQPLEFFLHLKHTFNVWRSN